MTDDAPTDRERIAITLLMLLVERQCPPTYLIGNTEVDLREARSVVKGFLTRVKRRREKS